MTKAAPPECGPARRALFRSFHCGGGIGCASSCAVVLSLLSSAALGRALGHDPAVASAGAGDGLPLARPISSASRQPATPYLLAGTGAASCFRAGSSTSAPKARSLSAGLGAAAVALTGLNMRPAPCARVVDRSGYVRRPMVTIATAIHLGRRVHEVLVTLLLELRSRAHRPGGSGGTAWPAGAGSCNRRSCRAAHRSGGCRPRRACRIHPGARRRCRAFRRRCGYAVRLRRPRRRTIPPAAAYAGFSIAASPGRPCSCRARSPVSPVGSRSRHPSSADRGLARSVSASRR